MNPLNKVRLIKLLFILVIVGLSHSCKKTPAEEPGFSFAFPSVWLWGVFGSNMSSFG